MHVISIPQMKKVIGAVVMKHRREVMFIGPAGCGKTAGVEQAAEEYGALLHPVLLGQYDTVDLKGTPWVSEGPDGYKSTVWHPASTLPFKGNPNFPTDRPIFLFLDELTSASVPVMGVCYQLINKHRIGEHELMNNVFIICAGNREMDKGIVNRMPMPLCNRLTWYEIGVDIDALCVYAQSKGWAPEFIAFWHFRKPLVSTYDPAKPEKAFASPRTWEMAVEYFMDTTMSADIKQASMAGSVGDGPSAEFWGFIDSWAKIAKIMPAILKDPAKAPLPEEASLRYAVSVAISGSMEAKNVETYHAYLVRMDPEFVVLAWQLAVKRLPKLFETEAFVDFSKRYKVIFQ